MDSRRHTRVGRSTIPPYQGRVPKAPAPDADLSLLMVSWLYIPLAVSVGVTLGVVLVALLLNAKRGDAALYDPVSEFAYMKACEGVHHRDSPGWVRRQLDRPPPSYVHDAPWFGLMQIPTRPLRPDPYGLSPQEQIEAMCRYIERVYGRGGARRFVLPALADPDSVRQDFDKILREFNDRGDEYGDH